MGTPKRCMDPTTQSAPKELGGFARTSDKGSAAAIKYAPFLPVTRVFRRKAPPLLVPLGQLTAFSCCVVRTIPLFPTGKYTPYNVESQQGNQGGMFTPI